MSAPARPDTPETRLAGFAAGLRFEDLPPRPVEIVKQLLLADIGTHIAGADEDGCREVLALRARAGGAPQARVWIEGTRLPAPAAAFVNGVMCRALDFCDAMAPGVHLGSSVIPAAVAAAELKGGATGQELIAAIAAGAEVGARLNLTEQAYDGFDPTGVATVFGAAAAAGRMLGLDAGRMRHALALAFNRAGGSFQSNVDGSLAVRLIQGWVAEAGVDAALLAAEGLTGPANFLTGVYGYAGLFGRRAIEPERFVAGLGEAFAMERMMFKRYPSCGVTQGATELALAARTELGIAAEEVKRAKVTLPPYAFRLVGHPFAPGANPRVDAQFSAQYTVANALLTGGARLADFTPEAVRRPEIADLVARIEVAADPALDARDHTAVDLEIETADGRVDRRGLDLAPGFPGRDLSWDEHRARFRDCLAYARRRLEPRRAETLPALIEGLDREADALALLPLIEAPLAKAA